MSELPEKFDNPEILHEESDVNVGAILRFGICLAVVALVAHVFLWWLLGAFGLRWGWFEGWDRR